MSYGSGGPIEKHGRKLGNYFVCHQEDNRRRETLSIVATGDESIGATLNNIGLLEVWCGGSTAREYEQKRAIQPSVFCLKSIVVSIRDRQTELRVLMWCNDHSLHQETFIFDRLVSPVTNSLEMPKDSYTKRMA